MKKIIIISIFILLITPLFIEGSPLLELNYPEIREIQPTYADAQTFPLYINYLVYLLVAVGAIVTVISLIRGGMSWLTAQGDPAKIKEGRDRITSSIFGLIIILSSFVFLDSINPDLKSIHELEIIETEEPDFAPGVYLSSENTIPDDREEMGEEVRRIRGPIRDLGNFELRSLRIVNAVSQDGGLLEYDRGEGEVPLTFYYAIVLHKEPGYRGNCVILLNDESEAKDFTNLPEDVSSITVIQVNENPVEPGRVVAYQKPDFNENYSFQNLDTTTKELTSLVPQLRRDLWSFDVVGKYGVILASGHNWETTNDGCGVFLDSKPAPDLKQHHMNICDPNYDPPHFGSYKSCSTHYAVFPLFR